MRNSDHAGGESVDNATCLAHSNTTVFTAATNESCLGPGGELLPTRCVSSLFPTSTLDVSCRCMVHTSVLTCSILTRYGSHQRRRVKLHGDGGGVRAFHLGRVHQRR
eukprot:COSAG05_NODE_13800_length_417_cov_23.980620_1_plen_106_part_01